MEETCRFQLHFTENDRFFYLKRQKANLIFDKFAVG